MAEVIDYRFRLRRGLAATWTSTNDVLLDGEFGLEKDTSRLKIGDGTTPWNSLPYWGDSTEVQTHTSTATITPNAADDVVVVSAQAAALTIANPTGTEAEGQGFLLRIKDNGTSRALTWGSEYRAIGGTLPTATAAGTWLYLPCTYNGTDDKWDVFFDQVGTADAAQVQSVTTASTVTPLHDDDMIVVSALAGALTIANPTGAAAWADGFVIALKDNGTARALTWGAAYRSMGAALPSTTTAGKWMYCPVSYNAVDSKWDVFPPTVQQ